MIPRILFRLVPLLAVAAVVAGAGPSEAASRLRDVKISAHDATFSLSVNLMELAALGTKGALTVTLDGRSVPATVETSVAGQQPPERSAVLALDTSGSMQGASIAGAVAAADAFVVGTPSDVALGLVTFSTTPSLLVAPTKDHAAVRRALAGVRAGGETALYDGILTSLDALRGHGDASLVVLSDGGDTTSTVGVDQLLRQLRTSAVSLQVVALTTRESAGEVLRRIAASRGVKPLAVAEATDLAAVFRGAASALNQQVSVKLAMPSSLAGRQVILGVALSTPRGRVEDSVVVTVPGIAQASSLPSQVREPGVFASSGLLRFALVALFLGLAGVVALGLLSKWGPVDPGNETLRLLQHYSLDRKASRVEREEPSAVLGQSAIARSVLELAGRVVQRQGLEERTALRLDRAEVPLRPAEWLIVRVGVMAAAFAIFVLVSGSVLWGLLTGAVVGWAATAVWLSLKASRRVRKFADALPEVLTLVAGSLSTGYSLPQSLDAVVREGSQPMAGELGRALAQARLGVPLEDALDDVAKRMDSRDFSWAVMAIRIQRDVGGNLSEVLRTASGTLRERAALRRQVSALSAEGRLSAYVLVGLPISMAAYMFTLRRDYIRPLYTQGLGIAMLVAAVILVIVGSLWMRKLIQVEV